MLKTNNPPVILGDILSGEYMKNTMLNNRSFICFLGQKKTVISSFKFQDAGPKTSYMAQKMLSIGAKAFPLERPQRSLFTYKETERMSILPKSGHFGGWGRRCAILTDTFL